jgi:hypothetical protein
MSLFAQPDMSLHLEGFFPAAGQSGILAALDLGVDIGAFSDQWRKSFLRIEWAALPNHVDPSKSISVTLLDSADGGQTFASGAAATTAAGAPFILPVISASIPGVAATGAPASFCDVPLPPALRGPIAVSVVMPAGTGDNTAALLQATIYFG